MKVHPSLREYIEQTKGQKKPLRYTPIEEVREGAKKFMLLAGDPIDVFRIENIVINVEDRKVRLRLYYPNKSEDLPLFLFFHAGGYLRGSIETEDPICRMLCNEAGCVIASLEYSLAPEFPYPTQLEEAFAVYMHFIKEGKKVIVGGESSGGNLAAALCLKIRDEKRPKPFAQVLVYPQLDYTNSLPAHKEFAKGYLLEEDGLQFCAECFVPKGVDLETPYLSPLFAEDFRGLPPAIIVTAECDVLRDDGKVYAQALQEMGIHVDFKEFKGMTHGFFQMASLVGKEAFSFVAEKLASRSG